MVVAVAIAFALGFDTFAVGLAAGTNNPSERASFRLYFHFGLFQFLMPIIGWHIGRTILPYIRDYDHWIAFGLLALIALRMLWES
ncbi:MAG: manganese efflux pump, partial [SAR324 cluster bacterium]|nr:manganese efflux pump [SAR324 cluster bacterium]